MYNVPIPSIRDTIIIDYLRNNKLVNLWGSERPAYEDLLQCDSFPEDQVFEWPEQFYDERGHLLNNENKRVFSIHMYGRFLCQINEKNPILLQLKNSELETEKWNPKQKRLIKRKYIQRKIETPDNLFKNLANEIMLKHEDTDTDHSAVIEAIKKLLSDMIYKYPTFAIHIDFLRALTISLSYKDMQWDNWYLNQLLSYSPQLFQRPFYYKRQKDDREDERLALRLDRDNEKNIYGYHILTYQTRYFYGEREWLLDSEIDKFCGIELRKVELLTPKKFRIHYDNLDWERQKLVRRCFNHSREYVDKYKQFVEDIIFSRLNRRLYSKKRTNEIGVDELNKLLKREYDQDKKFHGQFTAIILQVVQSISWLKAVGTVKKEAPKARSRRERSESITDDESELLFYDDDLTDVEKKARQYITDYIYARGSLQFRNELRDDVRKELLKEMAGFRLNDPEAFLDKIIDQYNNNIRDGKTVPEYEADHKRRNSVKGEVSKKEVSVD